MKEKLRNFVALTVLGILLLTGLTFSPAHAKEGGMKIDDDSNCEPEREENKLTAGTVVAWLNVTTVNFNPPYDLVIYDKGKPVLTIEDLNFEGTCSDPHYRYDADQVDLSALALGSYTAKLYTDGQVNLVSADSFRIV